MNLWLSEIDGSLIRMNKTHFHSVSLKTITKCDVKMQKSVFGRRVWRLWGESSHIATDGESLRWKLNGFTYGGGVFVFSDLWWTVTRLWAAVSDALAFSRRCLWFNWAQMVHNLFSCLHAMSLMMSSLFDANESSWL